MRTKLTYMLALALCLSAFATVETTAQEYQATPVTISKEKVRSGGKVYYAHVVLERQTLYSISKAYGVTVEEIYEANPVLGLEKEGLKKDQVILIPYKEEIAQQIAAQAAAAKDQADQDAAAREKAAQEKAAQEAAAKEKAAQEKAAQDAAAKEKAAQEKAAKKAAKVAAKEEAAREAAAKQAEDGYFIHKVRWYDDLDGIAKKYGVSKESIKNINRMTSDKLSRKQELKSPLDPVLWEGRTVQVDEPTPETDPDDARVIEFPSEKKDNANDEDKEGILDDLFVREGNHNVNISMLLPFSASKSGDRTSFMDLYCGSLLTSIHTMLAAGICP